MYSIRIFILLINIFGILSCGGKTGFNSKASEKKSKPNAQLEIEPKKIATDAVEFSSESQSPPSEEIKQEQPVQAIFSIEASTYKVNVGDTITVKGYLQNSPNNRDLLRKEEINISWSKAESFEVLHAEGNEFELVLKAISDGEVSGHFEYKNQVVEKQFSVTKLPSVAELKIVKIIVEGLQEIPEQEPFEVKAFAELEDGKKIEITSEAEWKSSTENIQIIEEEDESIKIKGVTAGEGQIVATYQDKIGELLIKVKEPAVEGLSISPAKQVVVVGTILNYQVTAQLENGQNEDVTAKASFTIASGSVANKHENNQIKAMAVGETDIIYQFEGKSVQAKLTVVDPVTINRVTGETKILAEKDKLGVGEITITVVNLKLAEDIKNVEVDTVSVDFSNIEFDLTSSKTKYLFDDVYQRSFKIKLNYKWIPVATQYNNQKFSISFLLNDGSTVKQLISIPIIIRMKATDPVQAQIDGSAGHPDALPKN